MRRYALETLLATLALGGAHLLLATDETFLGTTFLALGWGWLVTERLLP